MKPPTEKGCYHHGDAPYPAESGTSVVIPDLVASVTLPVAHGVPDAVGSFARIGMPPGGQVRPDTGIGHEGEVLVEVPQGRPRRVGGER